MATADLDGCDKRVEKMRPLPVVTRSHVEAARRRLGRMTFACDMARLTSCIKCAAAALGMPPPPPHLHECGNAKHNVCAHSVYRGPARKKMLKDNWGSVELYDTLQSIAIKDDCGGTCPQ